MGMGQGAEGSSVPSVLGSSPGPHPQGSGPPAPPGPGPEPSHRVGQAARLWALSLAARPGQRAKAPSAMLVRAWTQGLQRTQLLSAE